MENEVQAAYGLYGASHKQAVHELIEIQNIKVIARSEGTKQSF